MNQYSSLKAAWHTGRIEELRAGRDIIPTHIHLVISDLCNQNCNFCSYRMDGGFSSKDFPDENGNRNPVRFIPTEKVKEILDDCKELGVQAIEFTGGGEPTVHADCFELISYAQNLGLKTGLVTNGVRLSPDPALDRLDWLRISIDAGYEETYERIRQSKAWKKVIGNLKIAGSLDKPYVGVGYVITKENYREIVEGCRIARDAGVNYVRLSAMFSEKGAEYYAGIEDEINSSIANAKCLEDGFFEIVNFFGNRVDDLRKESPDYKFCGEQQFVLYIGGNQKVYTCCTNAYTPHGEIGDLKNMRFKEWIRNHKRYDFDARKCHHCQFNEKNRVINYMIQEHPNHVEFV